MLLSLFLLFLQSAVCNFANFSAKLQIIRDLYKNCPYFLQGIARTIRGGDIGPAYHLLRSALSALPSEVALRGAVVAATHGYALHHSLGDVLFEQGTRCRLLIATEVGELLHVDALMPVFTEELV